MLQTDFSRWLLSLAPIRLWAIILVALLAMLLAGPIVWVLVYGRWPAETAAQRISILGYTIYGLLLIAGAGQVALAMVKVHAKTLAGEFTIEGDDPPPAAPAVDVLVKASAGAAP